MSPRSLMLATSLALHAGCTGGFGGTETGNAVANVEMRARRADGGPPASAEQSGTAFGFDSVRAYVREIRLELDVASCADVATEELVAPVSCTGSTVLVEGPYVFDLLAATAEPSLDDLTIPGATYRRIDVRFDDADPSDGLVAETDPLADFTFLGAGDADLGGSTAFRMELAFNEDARFESPDAIEVRDGTTLSLLLDPTAWFGALPLATCFSDGDLPLDGTTVIVADGAGGCSDIEQALKEAIKTSGQLQGE